MILRELRRGDAPEVSREMQLNFGQELSVQGWDASHFQEVVDRSFRFPAGWVLALLRVLGRPPVHLYVAEDGGKIVGTTFLFFQRTHGYIAAVMTDPAFRGRGIASKLLERAEGACRRRKRRWAVLDVLSHNDVALRLYLKRGYRPLRVQHWVSRTLDPPPAPPAATGSVRPMVDSDLDPLLEMYTAQQPPEVRSILVVERSWISPPHYLQSVMVSTAGAWCTGPPGAPTGYVRANFTTPQEAGHLSAPLLAPTSTAEERNGLLHSALGWLRASGAREVVCEVPAYATEALRSLLDAGFTERWTMDTLALDLTPG